MTDINRIEVNEALERDIPVYEWMPEHDWPPWDRSRVQTLGAENQANVRTVTTPRRRYDLG